MIDADFVKGFTALAPNTGAVTLFTIASTGSSGDVFDSGTAYSHCRKHTLSKKDLQVLGEAFLATKAAKFTLFNNGETVKPRRGSYLREANGAEWTIQEVLNVQIDQGGDGDSPWYACACVPR